MKYRYKRLRRILAAKEIRDVANSLRRIRTIDYIKCRDAKASFAVVRPRQGLNLSEVRKLPFI